MIKDPERNLLPGMVCRHHSGRVYTVLDISNGTAPSDAFPLTVHYIGANGAKWSRPLKDFAQKFDVIFDGKNFAPPEWASYRDKS